MFCKKISLGCVKDSVGRYTPVEGPKPVSKMPPVVPLHLREPGSPLRPRMTREQWVEGAPADPGPDRDAGVDAIALPPEQRRRALDIINKVRAEKHDSVPLSQLGLRSLPESFGDDLSHAKHIDLSENKLYSLTTSVAKLTKLVSLNLSANLLPKLPDEIGQMKKLRKLDLRGNKLKALPDAIGEIHDLTHLYVDGNRLEALPRALGALTQLRVLTASYNLLQGHLPADLKYLEQLKKLDLSHNQIWNLPPIWSELFSRLKSVKLSNNQLQALPESFTLPSRSCDLDLSDNPLITLPGNYGGFTYKWMSDDDISSYKKHLTVCVRNTGIRQGLVNEGRLIGNTRGIVRQGPGLQHEDRPKPPPLFDDDWRSECSVEQYVRENQEVGGLEGLDYATQRANEYTREERFATRDNWVAGVANEYANIPGNNAQEPEPFPTMDPEYGAWPNLGTATPPGGYPAASVGIPPGPSYTPNGAGPSNTAYQPAAYVPAPDKAKVQAGMDVLRHELKALPPESQDAVLRALGGFPNELVEAKLAEVLEALHVAEPTRTPYPPSAKPAYSTRPAQAFAQSSTRPEHIVAPEGGGSTAFSAVRRTSDALGNLPRSWPQEQPVSPPPWERIPKRNTESALSSGPTDQDPYGMYLLQQPQMSYYGYPGVQIEELDDARPVGDPTPVVDDSMWTDYFWGMGERPY